MIFRQRGSAGTIFVVWVLAAGLGFLLVTGNNSAVSGLGQIILLVTVVFPLLIAGGTVLLGMSKHWAEIARRQKVNAESARLQLFREQHRQAVAAEEAAQVARLPRREALKIAVLQATMSEFERTE